MSLTLAYCSCRRDNKIEWLLASLARQMGNDWMDIIYVDFFHGAEGRHEETVNLIAPFNDQFRFTIVPPKPNPWNGRYRLTSRDWWAAASHRNTAICLCQSSHIAFIDDLSVAMPGWWDAAQEAVTGNYIACGAYKKVRNLVVVDGIPVSYEETESGTDDRLRRVTNDVSECTGGWLYGCSFLAPLNDLLEVGGFPEYMDGLGAEDYTLGIALTNAGKHLKYDRRMLTLESEELHFVEPPMRKSDKGVSPRDKSHAALHIAQQSRYFPNYYEGGIRALREHVLSGGDFPTEPGVHHDWFDGEPIAQMA